MDEPKPSYAFVGDLASEVQIPKDGITSRTLYNGDDVKVILFGFDSGQELSEHTASMPAIIHILQGEGRLTLGEAEQDVTPGVWAHMPANLPHSVFAKTPLVMLLTMIKAARAT